jgi:uncharacterized protein YdeI (YjbR/CyaY-like superfamily)
MPRRPTGSHSKTFRATLEKFSGKGVNWTIARLPFSVQSIWQTRGVLRVIVEVNGFEYRTSLMPNGRGEHFFIVNKKAQKGARILSGSSPEFRLTPDLSRQLRIPIELQRALNEDRAVRKWFDGLSLWFRRWLSEAVGEAKSPEARLRRAERTAEQLMQAMEAEHELPPMIRLAFNRNPGAEERWLRMSATQRRGHLLSIFYYRNPQSRLGRIEKLIELLLNPEAKGKFNLHS